MVQKIQRWYKKSMVGIIQGTKSPAFTSLTLYTKATSVATSQPTTSFHEELDAHLQSDPTPCTESPVAWWSSNAAQFPLLAAEASCYLSVPPTLFLASDCLAQLCRSTPIAKQPAAEHTTYADMLLFIKHNLQVIGYSIKLLRRQ